MAARAKKSRKKSGGRSASARTGAKSRTKKSASSKRRPALARSSKSARSARTVGEIGDGGEAQRVGEEDIVEVRSDEARRIAQDDDDDQRVDFIDVVTAVSRDARSEGSRASGDERGHRRRGNPQGIWRNDCRARQRLTRCVSIQDASDAITCSCPKSTVTMCEAPEIHSRRFSVAPSSANARSASGTLMRLSWRD